MVSGVAAAVPGMPVCFMRPTVFPAGSRSTAKLPIPGTAVGGTSREAPLLGIRRRRGDPQARQRDRTPAGSIVASRDRSRRVPRHAEDRPLTRSGLNVQ